MRWQIKTEVNDQIISTIGNKQTINRTTKTTRTQYITVGDIVGAAKSATGAVKNLVARIPNYINQFKSNKDAKSQAQAALAQSIYNVASPLATIIKGVDVYKNAMRVIGILTPIMKLVARGTGVWCSPGNVADISQIVAGTVQQILIALVTQAIVRLKEWIWNFEFELRSLSTEASVEITKILRNNSEKLNKRVSQFFDDPSDWMLDISSDYATSRTKEQKSALSDRLNALASNSGNKNNVKLSNDAITDLFKGKKLNASGEVLEFGKGWQTEFLLSDGIHVRELRGSLNDGGIEYSIINAKGEIEWLQSSKTDGSFCCFCKILKPNNTYRYLAGSAPYISVKDITYTADENWSRNTYKQYNRDYYTYENKKKLKVKKITKNDKDRYILNTYRNVYTTGLFDKKDTYKPAQGIWYSDDNGETWTQTPITDEYIGYMYEYKEKVGDIPERVVVSSYNYNGLRYTEDGTSYSDCLTTEGETLNHGRFVLLTANENNKVRVYNEDGIDAQANIDGNIRKLVKIETIPINTNIEVEVDITNPGYDEAHANLWKAIRDFIHYRHPEILNTLSESDWANLRDRVFADTYTLEDAKAQYGE